MIIGIPKETFPDERRVAIVPAVVPTLTKAGCEVLVESDAGLGSSHPDASYVEKGARITTRDEVFALSDVVAQVRAYGANPEAGREDLKRLKRGQVIVGLFEPLTSVMMADQVAQRGATLFAMELIPRTTRAQSMDVLSSMATIGGYKAVLLAAEALPKMFPMMMTAAGTITPAKVFVIGAGVAGLQAIATSRRLGAVVQAFDVRPAVKEQVLSLGAKFVELPVVPTHAEDASGYAKAQDENFYLRQRELMAEVVAGSDVVITTAAVPGMRAPVLVTNAMVARMAPGSVIVDLAAERGGNCEPTRAGETVRVGGVTILGPVNLPATVPFHASHLYAKNIANFLQHLLRDGSLKLDLEDEIVRETLVTHGGEVVHPKVGETLRVNRATVGAGRALEE